MPILLKWQVVQTKFITEPPSPLVPVLENVDIPVGNLRGKSFGKSWKFWNSAQSIWFPVNFRQPSDIEWPLAVHWKSVGTKIPSSAESTLPFAEHVFGVGRRSVCTNLGGWSQMILQSGWLRKEKVKLHKPDNLVKKKLVVWLKRVQTPFPHCRLAKPFTSDPHFPQYWKLCPPVSVSHPQQLASQPHI